MHNKIKDAFEGVKAEEQLKANTKAYLERRTGAYRRSAGRFRRKYAVAAALSLCIFLIIGGYASYSSPVAVVSVDINPSLELGVNRYDRVVAVTAYDSEASQIADAAAVKHQNYVSAVEELLDSVEAAGYLSEEALVELTVVGASEERCAAMLTDLQNSKGCQQRAAVCYSSNQETAAEAHDAGLSCGKYRAFLELQALDPTVSVADVQDLTMRQIQDLIDACCEETDDAADGQTHGGGQHKGEHAGGGASGASAGSGNGTGNGTGNTGSNSGEASGASAGTGNGTGSGAGTVTGAGAGYGNGSTEAARSGSGSGAGNGSGTGAGGGSGFGTGTGSGGYGQNGGE